MAARRFLLLNAFLLLKYFNQLYNISPRPFGKRTNPVHIDI